MKIVRISHKLSDLCCLPNELILINPSDIKMDFDINIDDYEEYYKYFLHQHIPLIRDLRNIVIDYLTYIEPDSC